MYLSTHPRAFVHAHQRASVSFRTFLFEGKNVFYEVPQVSDYDRLSLHMRPLTSNLFV